MTFVYETKNKEVKNYANVMSQRINIAKSLIYKSAMRINNFLVEHANGFPPLTSCEKMRKETESEMKKKGYYTKLSSEEQELLSHPNCDISSSKYINHKGTKYSINNFIVDDQNNPTTLLKILDILHIEEIFHFIVEKFQVNGFDNHYRSYRVGESQNCIIMYKIDECRSLPFNLHKTFNGDLYFKVKKI
jgi:hypothetical protein